MKAGFNKWVRDTRGAGFVEYIVLVGLIALSCIAVYTRFGDAVREKTDNQKDTMAADINDGPGQ